MFFVLLLAYTEELIPAQKSLAFLPSQGCKKIFLATSPIPYPEYLYLSISAFLVNLTAPKKQRNYFLMQAKYHQNLD